MQGSRENTGSVGGAAPPARRPLSRHRRLLFIGIVMLVIGLFAELLLQTYNYIGAGGFLFRRAVPPIYEANDTRCYGLKPDLDYAHHTNEFKVRIYTNAQGFRTDSRRAAIPVEKDPDVYRVMFLGPSFTMGWANDYEDTYVALIGERLKVSGKRVEVVNVGTPSQGPTPQLCWLER